MLFILAPNVNKHPEAHLPKSRLKSGALFTSEGTEEATPPSLFQTQREPDVHIRDELTTWSYEQCSKIKIKLTSRGNYLTFIFLISTLVAKFRHELF